MLKILFLSINLIISNKYELMEDKIKTNSIGFLGVIITLLLLINHLIYSDFQPSAVYDYIFGFLSTFSFY
ncbi:MAG: hypothetical protein B655_1319 [Methanobacterium sp. Maddingley MBC34]|nr:MAG: hypothetical protein B655_1319 [Methanobacterium sp. Maddingley MBC34]